MRVIFAQGPCFNDRHANLVHFLICAVIKHTPPQASSEEESVLIGDPAHPFTCPMLLASYLVPSLPKQLARHSLCAPCLPPRSRSGLGTVFLVTRHTKSFLAPVSRPTMASKKQRTLHQNLVHGFAGLFLRRNPG